MEPIGKSLVVIGGILVVAGAFIWLLGGKGWLGWMGNLPGDIRIETKSGGFYFPLTTCLLVSVLLSALAAILRRIFSA